jgi:hypothetical protein
MPFSDSSRVCRSASTAGALFRSGPRSDGPPIRELRIHLPVLFDGTPLSSADGVVGVASKAAPPTFLLGPLRDIIASIGCSPTTTIPPPSASTSAVRGGHVPPSTLPPPSPCRSRSARYSRPSDPRPPPSHKREIARTIPRSPPRSPRSSPHDRGASSVPPPPTTRAVSSRLCLLGLILGAHATHRLGRRLIREGGNSRFEGKKSSAAAILASCAERVGIVRYGLGQIVSYILKHTQL